MCACFLICPEKLADVVAALYKAFWVECEATQLPAQFELVLGRVLGSEVAKTVTTLASPRQLLLFRYYG